KVGQLLLVTNNRYEADLISRALRPHAYKVTSVSSRQEAVALLDKEKFSTAVVRLTLPDASGLDVMTEVKERNPNLPVLIIRSGESGIVDEELIAAGADGIIQRPFNNAEIALQINSARQRVHRFTPTILSAIRRAADSE
ncbi:MAG: response regulator, partial [bacterium]|nr:response regulator [bacterium]